MAARPVVVMLDPEVRHTIEELAREVLRQLSRFSSERAVFLCYGQKIISCAPKSRDFETQARQRGAMLVGVYRPLTGLATMREDLEAAWREWYGETHRG